MDMTPIDKLLHDYISGRISAEELEQLEAWSRESEENRQILELIDGNSDLGNELSRMYRYDKERVWKAVCEEDRRYMNRRSLFRTLRFTAAALILIGMFVSGALLYEARERINPNRNHFAATLEPGTRHAVLELPSGEVLALNDSLCAEIHKEASQVENSGSHPRKFGTSASYSRPGIPQIAARSSRVNFPAVREERVNTVRVPRGGEYSLTLPDGTRVWLNAGSSISYPLHFGSERRVSIRGEVYFEVAHDSRHPFIVSAAGAEMTVLGTSFNVAAYENEARVETTLVTGSVRVASQHASVVLTPGQQAGLDSTSGTIDVKEVNVETYTMWRRGLLVFYEEPLRDICRKLERWYNVKIDTSSPTLDGVRYTGMFKRHETLNTIADLMNLTNDVVFFQDDDGVIRVVRKSRHKPASEI